MTMRRSEPLRCCFILCGLSVLCYYCLSLHFKWTCKNAVNDFRHMTVTDYSLNEILNGCLNVGINAYDIRFNFTYIKKNVRNFQCSQTRKYLTVPRSLTALASYPGSGNTWTREMLETVTGMHTGSIYADWNFVGSKLCPARGHVFIVKTHTIDDKPRHADCDKMGVTHLNYTQAIFILRNPYDALVAEFNRQLARQIETKAFFNAGVELASENDFKSTKWDTFLSMESEVWTDMALYWLQKFDKPIHVLAYERLRHNTVLEIYNLMKFLDIQITFQSLFCLSSNTTGNYHRIKANWMTKENIFAKRHRILINDKIKRVYKEVGIRRHIADILHSYVLPVSI